MVIVVSILTLLLSTIPLLTFDVIRLFTLDFPCSGTWVCLDGEGIDVQDKRWNDGEPNNVYGNEDCAVGVDLGWFDLPCDHTRKSICQRHASPAL